MSRTPSVAGSDRYSTLSGVTGYWPQNPDNVSPSAAYVAPFGAIQVVNEHRATSRGRRASDASDDEDEEAAANKGDAQFSPQALSLINHFLDQLLYSFLSTARSTSLHALRPAVTEVLRHRLAKEAVANADEELQELLAGGEEDEERNAQLQAKDSNRKWDLELVWKRTRLRVMVYMRLGEMEDDDEERYVKEQELFYGRETDSRRFSSSSGLVSWSAAIFLTSVLEYIAEQSLQAAGSVAFTRASRPSSAKPSATIEGARVEDFDVEKLALDARLGRLWRTWRKTLRNDRQRPMTPNYRAMPSRSSFTRDRAVSMSALRRGSMGYSREESMAAEEQYRVARQQYLHGIGNSTYDYPEAEYPEHILASNIPLPMPNAQRDIDEIEVPGLAKNSDHDTEEDIQPRKARRNSFTSPTSENAPNSQQSRKSGYFPLAFLRPSLARQRSKSVPNPPRTPKLEIPGAFPTMPDEPDVETTDALADPEPEPKASAVDMQGFKQNREGSKVLLNGVGNLPRKADARETELPQSERLVESEQPVPDAAADNNYELPPPVTTDRQKEDHSSGVLGGIAAGATAVAGAAAVATGINMYKDDGEGDEEPKSRKEDFVQQHEETTERTNAALPGPVDRSSKEIEELDQEKSMVDLKSIIATESGPRSHEQSLSRTPPVAEPIPEPEPLQEARVLDQGNSIKSIEPHVADSAEPSIATTVPASVVETATKGPSPPSPKALGENLPSRSDPTTIAALEAPVSPSERMDEALSSEQKARDMPMIGSPRGSVKPERLIINGDLPADQPKPLTVDTKSAVQPVISPESARDPQQVRNVLVDSETPPPPPVKDDAVKSPNEQTRASAPRSVANVSVPFTPIASNTIRESKTWESAEDQRSNASPKSRSIYSTHQKQNSKGEVQDHPAIQHMATPKKERALVAASGSGASTPPVVTSASIRGPEDFDNFLQGDDTVKYTLTPENVRDERSRPSTGESKFVSKQTSNPASVARMTGRDAERASPRASLRKNSSPAPSSQRQSRASRSQSTTKAVPADEPQQDNEANRARRRSISKPAPRNTSQHRRSGLMAREPQVLTQSTRDFADFIRSTGPDREPEVKRLNTTRSTTSLHSLRNSGRSQSVGASSTTGERERTKSLTQTTMAAENIPPVPKMPAKSSPSKGPSLEARSATGAASGNKDLINFIRDGPDEGEHRISRNVAPFRNTMDSDQFGDMGGDFATKRSIDVNGSSIPEGRSTSTVPSQSTPAHRSTPSTQDYSSTPASRVAAAEPEGDLTRKRYRNKDPYAIPSDSEDEEDETEFITALPRKNRQPQEESLVDFLRNNEPPSNNSPRPIGSAAAAKNRMSMSQNQTQVHPPPPPAEPVASAPPPRTTSMQAQTNGPRPVTNTTNATPRETGPKLEARGAGSRIPRGNAGARLGAYEQSNTGDLADFLRSSGPAEESTPPPRRFEPPPSPVKEKKRGFFSRFKKEKA